MFHGKEVDHYVMLYPAMNKLTQYIPNRYMMVNVVARRARQIAAEAEVSRTSIWTRSP